MGGCVCFLLCFSGLCTRLAHKARSPKKRGNLARAWASISGETLRKRDSVHFEYGSGRFKKLAQADACASISGESLRKRELAQAHACASISGETLRKRERTLAPA